MMVKIRKVKREISKYMGMEWDDEVFNSLLDAYSAYSQRESNAVKEQVESVLGGQYATMINERG